MKKFISLLIVLGIVSVAGWQVYQRILASKKNTQRKPPSVIVAVEIAPVQKSSIKDMGVFTGSLLPKSQFLVASKISGWLKKLMVNTGDMVERGQVIAILDDRELSQQVEQARAELEVEKANLENCVSDLNIATREYERAKVLREKLVASEAELDTAQAQINACQARYKVSNAQIARKEAALKTAQIRLSYTKIQASWEEGLEARIIGERFVDEGALLQANQSIVSVLEESILTGVIHVIERDYPKVKVGQQALVTTDAYPDNTFIAHIVRIAPLLKESSRQARMELEIPNSNRLLKPGMFIRARIEFNKRDQATVIPVSALVKRNNKQGVFLADLENQKAHFVPVTLGIINNDLAEVIKPSLNGHVVTLGHHLLEDGMGILLPGNNPPPQSAKSPHSKSQKNHPNAKSGDAG